MGNMKKILSVTIIMCMLLSVTVADSAEAKTKLSSSKLTIGAGMSKKICVSGTNKKPRWKSTNKKVASVSAKGVIKANKEGSANIIAKVGKKKLTCRVKVRAATDAEKVFILVNKKRKEAGLSELQWDNQLLAPAMIRAREASMYWSHTRPDGRPWNTVSRKTQGENLGRKYERATEIMDAWMASPGHRENILRSEFTRIAVASYVDENGEIFWCQSFGY